MTKKIQVSEHYSIVQKEMTVEQFLVNSIYFPDEHTPEKNFQLIARLVGKLYEKGIFDLEDVKDFSGGKMWIME